jgi:hypothetical protein
MQEHFHGSIVTTVSAPTRKFIHTDLGMVKNVTGNRNYHSNKTTGRLKKVTVPSQRRHSQGVRARGARVGLSPRAQQRLHYAWAPIDAR